MTAEGIPPLRWKELYHVAMLESNGAKLPKLLDDAINSVLDQIEETLNLNELEELNKVLNHLRSRRKEVICSTSKPSDSPDQNKAA